MLYHWVQNHERRNFRNKNCIIIISIFSPIGHLVSPHGEDVNKNPYSKQFPGDKYIHIYTGENMARILVHEDR